MNKKKAGRPAQRQTKYPRPSIGLLPRLKAGLPIVFGLLSDAIKMRKIVSSGAGDKDLTVVSKSARIKKYRIKCGIYMSTGFGAGVLALALLASALGVSAPTVAESGFEKIEIKLPLGAITVNSNSILQAKSPGQREWASRFLMNITAYSSSVDETDSTPHVTASGTRTRNGVVASNLFPMGTRIKIPELFGEKILVVEDRMHGRFTDRIDVWMPSKWQALYFGKKQAEVEIVEL